MRRVYRRRRIVALAILLALLGGTYLALRAAWLLLRSPSVTLVGLRSGALGGEAAATPQLLVPTSATRVVVDGQQVPLGDQRRDGRALPAVQPLGEGEHRIEVVEARRFARDGRRTLSFSVDVTPPKVEVQPVEPIELGAATEVRGQADEGSVVEALGKPVELQDDGRFTIPVPAPAPSRVVVTARDRVGNVATAEVAIAAVQPVTRAVHLTALAWVNDGLREPVLAMLDAKKLNAIQLDIKDEGGEVGPRTAVAMAGEVGADKARFDLRKAVETIHGKGGRVIGRIVVYRDPKMADHFWETGQRDRVLQTPGGERFGAYGGGFLNPSNPVVQAYVEDLAVEAAQAGVDEILLDYVRRPDGKLSGMVFPGLPDDEGELQAVEDTIVAHVARIHEKVRAAGARLGASVYGIAASRPDEIAQDIPRMSRHLDYVAPMIYPSHWAKGEFGIAEPNRTPGPVIAASMKEFVKAVEGTGAAVVPWLQDFSLGVPYGEREVRAQIEAADANGGRGFLLWDAACTYTLAALDVAQA